MASIVVAVIPAREGSRRFRGKVLAEFEGRPLLYHTWKALSGSKGIDRLLIATDSERIQSCAKSFGAEVIKTSSDNLTGSDRVAEVARRIGGDLFINVQADNFGIKASTVQSAIKKMKQKRSIGCATLVHRIRTDNDLFNPNKVKVLVDRRGRALWFSRYPIPYLVGASRGNRHSQHSFWGHIGIYFFRREQLLAFGRWNRTASEKAESLEQLRILENGGCIQTFETSMQTISVDTPDDLKKIRTIAISKRKR